jgi:hypothetical protein
MIIDDDPFEQELGTLIHTSRVLRRNSSRTRGGRTIRKSNAISYVREYSTRKLNAKLDIEAQHGPVRILVKDGKPCD